MGAEDGGGEMQGKKEGRGRKRRYLQCGRGEEPSLNSIIHYAIIITALYKYSHILYKYTIIEESIILESLLKATPSRA